MQHNDWRISCKRTPAVHEPTFHWAATYGAPGGAGRFVRPVPVHHWDAWRGINRAARRRFIRNAHDSHHQHLLDLGSRIGLAISRATSRRTSRQSNRNPPRRPLNRWRAFSPRITRARERRKVLASRIEGRLPAARTAKPSWCRVRLLCNNVRKSLSPAAGHDWLLPL